ncbi:MAG TPA: hypothetical protein VFP59_19955 [Candidatus Angelobacter sp.]|nr:hypothetical protein [Candidatus Angelobacter sp.]
MMIAGEVETVPKLRRLALVVIAAHWIVAVSHLFVAAKILPAPNHVSWLGITFISLGHWLVLIALWKLGDKVAGLVLLIFFLAALGADVYEHFLHAAPNNLLMVATGRWTAWFDASVFALLALEILGCSLGILSVVGKTRRRPSEPSFSPSFNKQGPREHFFRQLI